MEKYKRLSSAERMGFIRPIMEEKWYYVNN